MKQTKRTRAKLVPIGNSRGVRIPKPLIEQAGLTDEVDLRVEDGAIVIRPARKPRDGWAKAMKEMAKRGEDKLLDSDANWSNKFDEEEWQW